jgi:hypothetical protein
VNRANHGKGAETFGRKMMKMSKHEDMEALEGQIRPWLGNRKFPLEKYRNPPSYNKVLLHNLVCVRTQPPSDRQLIDLYRELHSSEARLEGGHTSAAGFPSNEDLKKFFSPPTPAERLPYLYKY